MIVTIDGPAGSGKSTAAQGLAQRLGFDFIDTGAMYRTVAQSCRDSGIDCENGDAVAAHARTLEIGFDGESVLLNGEDITTTIRDPSISEAASRVAQHPDVREELVRQQRRLVAERSVVTEGRDQGTVVFPDAECKFFLEADARVRAQRRREELLGRGVDVPLETTLKQIRDRDERDRTRPISPLKPAKDALRIDSSRLSADDVLDQLETLARQVLDATS